MNHIAKIYYLNCVVLGPPVFFAKQKILVQESFYSTVTGPHSGSHEFDLSIVLWETWGDIDFGG